MNARLIVSHDELFIILSEHLRFQDQKKLQHNTLNILRKIIEKYLDKVYKKMINHGTQNKSVLQRKT